MPLIEHIKKIIRFFKSAKCAAITIALLIIIYFLGLVIPQKWMFSTRIEYDEWIESAWYNRVFDFLGFSDIYLSPLTIILLAIFFINLLLVILKRVPVILKRAYLTGEPASFSVEEMKRGTDVKVLRSVHDTGKVTEKIKTFLKSHRYHLMKGKEEHTFMAVRNRLSPIGFLFFHASFFLLLIGGLLLAYTRFSGNLVLTEGEHFNGNMKRFYKIAQQPKIFREPLPLGLFVKKIRTYYEDDVSTDLVVDLDVRYLKDESTEVLKINEPVRKGPLSIIVQNIGVSPLFVVKDLSGRIVDGVYVSLNVLKGQRDYFELKLDGLYTFNVGFFPDYIIKDGVETSNSLELNNPAVHITVQKQFVQNVYDNTVKLHGSADIGSYTVSFEDIRYWAEFLIVKEYGKMPLNAGFILASIGLIMRLVFYQKRIRLAFESDENGSIIYIDGKGEYFQHSFRDEMGKIVKELEELLC